MATQTVTQSHANFPPTGEVSPLSGVGLAQNNLFQKRNAMAQVAVAQIQARTQRKALEAEERMAGREIDSRSYLAELQAEENRALQAVQLDFEAGHQRSEQDFQRDLFDEKKSFLESQMKNYKTMWDESREDRRAQWDDQKALFKDEMRFKEWMADRMDAWTWMGLGVKLYENEENMKRFQGMINQMGEDARVWESHRRNVEKVIGGAGELLDGYVEGGFTDRAVAMFDNAANQFPGMFPEGEVNEWAVLDALKEGKIGAERLSMLKQWMEQFVEKGGAMANQDVILEQLAPLERDVYNYLMDNYVSEGKSLTGMESSPGTNKLFKEIRGKGIKGGYQLYPAIDRVLEVINTDPEVMARQKLLERLTEARGILSAIEGAPSLEALPAQSRAIALEAQAISEGRGVRERRSDRYKGALRKDGSFDEEKYRELLRQDLYDSGKKFPGPHQMFMYGKDWMGDWMGQRPQMGGSPYGETPYPRVDI